MLRPELADRIGLVVDHAESVLLAHAPRELAEVPGDPSAAAPGPDGQRKGLLLAHRVSGAA